MNDEDKLHHIHSKLDDLHGYLKDHIGKEEEEFRTMHSRLVSVEDDNKELKTIYKIFKMIVIFIGGTLAIFWGDFKSWLGR